MGAFEAFAELHKAWRSLVWHLRRELRIKQLRRWYLKQTGR